VLVKVQHFARPTRDFQTSGFPRKGKKTAWHAYGAALRHRNASRTNENWPPRHEVGIAKGVGCSDDLARFIFSFLKHTKAVEIDSAESLKDASWML
jgi:hypothetical protein